MEKESWAPARNITGKERKAHLSSVHSYLRNHYGKPEYCSNKKCKGESKLYEWCKKTGRTSNRTN